MARRSPSRALRIAASAMSRLPLGQPQLGEAGLGLPAEGTRLAVCLLGRGELAAKSQQLGLAVVSDAPGCGVSASRSSAGTLGRASSRASRPRPAELQDLGAMDPAAARERDDLGLSSAQGVERPASTPARGRPRRPPGSASVSVGFEGGRRIARPAAVLSPPRLGLPGLRRRVGRRLPLVLEARSHSSQRGRYQFHSPSSFITDGSRTALRWWRRSGSPPRARSPSA